MVTSYLLQRRIGHNSSRVTKGKQTFVEFGDGRSAWARRWNDLVLMHARDLGGYETLSEAQLSICRRAATLETELEAMEGRKSAGQSVDIELYARLASRLCRLLELIGIKRLARPIDPLSEMGKCPSLVARSLETNGLRATPRFLSSHSLPNRDFWEDFSPRVLLSH